MSNIQPLDNTAHADLRVIMQHSAELGSAVNQAPLVPAEFEEAQRHYPILFRRDEEAKLQAIAILGFERDENLFLTDGRWDGYIPAIMRRGPFFIGGSDGEDPVILVDMDHKRIRKGGEEGAPLFLEHGGHAPALEFALAALRTIHLGGQQAQAMQEAFEDLGLVEEVKMNVRLSEDKAVNFEGLLAVTFEQIGRLEGDALERLNKAGLLPLAVFAASSLNNMQRLAARKQAKDAA
jgi:hypothetical protein